MRLLPSQRAWVTAVCEHLIDGDLVIVRGTPGSGKTTLLEAVAREMGDTAVVTGGRGYTETNQATRRDDLQQGIDESLAKHGTAHLLFDDYPHALQRSQGLRLQRLLLHVLIDSERSVDIGALLTGRWARSMHLVSSGSPLVPRALLKPLPIPTEEDFDAVGCPRSAQAVATVGGNPTLLAKVVTVLGRPSLHQAREAAELLAPKWVEDAPWGALRWLKDVVRQGPAPLPGNDLDAEALAPLVFSANSVQDGGEERYDVMSALRSQAAVAVLDGRAPTWPSGWADSVATFCGLLDGAPAIVWVDRYLAADPPELLRFLHDVRRSCATRIKMLVAQDAAGSVDASVVAALGALDCEIRIMHWGDRKQLHDRHLIFQGGRQGGVVMPTGRVVLCQDPPGPAMAVQAPQLDQKLIREAWGRGRAPS
ncbi:AAA family ATPase [Streptomyces sp. NPDC001381]|uniref:AAA family ATPase n=1 Tax=Streptomyces sp. NPDC001381 TaxID=3364567 RepID=UPI00368763E6